MRVGTVAFSIRRLIVAVAVGLAVGVGTFALTGYWPGGIVFMGLCQPTIQAGFDPWTGSPHGATWHCPPESAQAGATVDTRPQTMFVDPVPPEIASRRAVPIPLGFILGGGVVLLWPLIHRGVHSARASGAQS